MKNNELCPICGKGHVTRCVDEVQATYKEQTKMLPSLYLQCDTCTSDFAGLEESRANKRAMLAFRKQVDGLLAGAEIEALRKRYKINQAQAARLFGGGPVAFSKYENDDVMQSESMDNLLRMSLVNESAFWSLAELKGMAHELKASRAALLETSFNAQTTNVIQVDFGDKTGRFVPSSKVQFRTTQIVVSDDPQEQRKWK